MEDYTLKVFEAVARNRSFTAAARELDVTQPAVSQKIAELEKSLGANLFVRNRTSVSLT
ncbi:MAG: LysR family transcriptional regulator [Bacteroidales bacterium]|nr:LysR family transcriptional regulator [Bacteroidales bacterium]